MKQSLIAVVNAFLHSGVAHFDFDGVALRRFGTEVSLIAKPGQLKAKLLRDECVIKTITNKR